MRHGTIPGVGRPVSRIAVGTADPGFPRHGPRVLDTFFEAGGTCIETAWIYGEGRHEAMLGRWLADRGMESEAVIVTKGAPHDPVRTPEHLEPHLDESLERLGIGSVDVYLAHRDNESVPVGEYVDAFDRLRRAGRIRAFGGSNWSLGRLRAANAYAAANGLAPMTVLSDHLSLARMVEPPWDGSVSVGDLAARRWLADTGTVVMPWSSQARGFFARADPRDRSDPELVRCWYSDDNFARLERARKLAATRGVDVTAIALAWVLAQRFPTFPVIGPRSVAELEASLAALAVELSPIELRRLSLDGVRHGRC